MNGLPIRLAAILLGLFIAAYGALVGIDCYAVANPDHKQAGAVLGLALGCVGVLFGGGFILAAVRRD